MKSAIFYNICFGFASVARAVAVPVEPQLQGFDQRQEGKHCNKGFQGVTVIEEVAIDETKDGGNVAEYASPGYPGRCDPGPQVCQFFWQDNDGWRCRAICHCPISSICTESGNYCFYQRDNGGCYCT